MLESFLPGLGGKLAERWIAVILSPAFLFWAGGLAAWAFGHDHGWDRIEHWISTRSNAVQVAVTIAILLLATMSGTIAQRLSLPILRILEGYWPRWAGQLRRRLVGRQARRYGRDRSRFDQLAPRIVDETASTAERAEYAAIDRRLRGFPAEANPVDPERLMPTRLGNILRAAESRPLDKYGLDSVKCWPRLWLLLPDGVKKEIADARGGLDAAAAVALWGVLFVIWTVWAWWAAPIGVAVAIGSHRWILGSAETYGELVESAFDLHRRALYEAVRWPLPETPAEEQAMGRALTEYLWWGSVAETPFARPAG